MVPSVIVGHPEVIHAVLKWGFWRSATIRLQPGIHFSEIAVFLPERLGANQAVGKRCATREDLSIHRTVRGIRTGQSPRRRLHVNRDCCVYGSTRLGRLNCVRWVFGE